MDKPALRAQLRAARDAFLLDRAPSLPIPATFCGRLRPGLVLASYIAVGSEADPAPLVAAARAAGCTMLLPWVADRATPLRFLEWSADSLLERGPFHLRQPPASARELAPDLILTPLLGFDAAGNRLGQGAGHYDRAFERHPAAWRLGLAWSVQQVASLPADPWDVPLHAIATETDTILTGAD